MQDLLSQLDLPISIGLIVLVLVILAVVVLLARRARQSQTPSASEPSVSEPIDYTSLPIDEEPTSMAQRFKDLSLAGKILVILVPTLVLLGMLALALTLLPGGDESAVAPTPVPVTLRVRDAAVVRTEPPTIGITIETTGLANGAVVTAELLEDGAPFPWMNPDQAQATVRNNRAELQVQRADGAPTPTEGRSYTVIARGPDGTSSAPKELDVPSIAGIAEAFFEKTVAEAPTTPPPPTSAPTVTPAATPTPAPTATPELPTGPVASVINGGNVRRQPIVVANNVVAGVNAGEEVQLLSRTPNGAWYRVRTASDAIGWVSTTLLRIPPGISVPVAPVVTVFVTGPVYERPDRASTELDRVNQGEVVELTRRTAAGDWYEIVNLRDVAGWAPAELLGIPPEVASIVLVEEE